MIDIELRGSEWPKASPDDLPPVQEDGVNRFRAYERNIFSKMTMCLDEGTSPLSPGEQDQVKRDKWGLFTCRRRELCQWKMDVTVPSSQGACIGEKFGELQGKSQGKEVTCGTCRGKSPTPVKTPSGKVRCTSKPHNPEDVGFLEGLNDKPLGLSDITILGKSFPNNIMVEKAQVGYEDEPIRNAIHDCLFPSWETDHEDSPKDPNKSQYTHSKPRSLGDPAAHTGNTNPKYTKKRSILGDAVEAEDREQLKQHTSSDQDDADQSARLRQAIETDPAQMKFQANKIKEQKEDFGKYQKKMKSDKCGACKLMGYKWKFTAVIPSELRWCVGSKLKGLANIQPGGGDVTCGMNPKADV